MNERIQQLIKQATILEDDDLFVREVFDREKFAELIVRECAKACEKNSYLALNGWQRANQIREHFGVKE